VTRSPAKQTNWHARNREWVKIVAQRKRCQSLPPLAPGEAERLVAEFKARRDGKVPGTTKE
jgi:hypothetical protein